MMASLRARLLAAVLALTACGLLLVGGITYVEQRSFQYSRIDQQLKALVMPVSHQLEQMPGARGPMSGTVRAAGRTSASRPAPTARSATRAVGSSTTTSSASTRP
jgi:hypothetical protein